MDGIYQRNDFKLNFRKLGFTSFAHQKLEISIAKISLEIIEKKNLGLYILLIRRTNTVNKTFYQ